MDDASSVEVGKAFGDRNEGRDELVGSEPLSAGQAVR
jgi:hypothetical protein